MHSKVAHLQCGLQTTLFKTNIKIIDAKYSQKTKKYQQGFRNLIAQ